MQSTDFVGLYGIIPTPAKQNASRIDALDTVDLDESASLVEKLIVDGVSGIIALGTTGECATLSLSDYRKFVDCIVQTARGRVPLFIGSTALGGHDVAERMAFLRDRKASGTLLGLPMWQPMTTEMAVDFYAQIAAMFPDVAVMIYANARAFRYKFPTEFWRRVAEVAPTVTSAKFSRPQNLPELIEVTNGRIHFMPNESTVQSFYKVSPATTTSCWATAAAMGPAPALRLVEAVRAGNSEEVASIARDIAWANEPIKPIFEDPEIFASYNIQAEKARINAAGYCRCGPVRPPYNHFPPEYAVAAAECGKRWSEIQQRYKLQQAAE